MTNYINPTPVENYGFNKSLQIVKAEIGSGTNYLVLNLYAEKDLAISVQTRDQDADFTVMDLTAEQARAIGTMMLYAAQQADEAEQQN